MTRHRPPVPADRQGPSTPRGLSCVRAGVGAPVALEEGGAGGRTLPPAYWPHRSPGRWWCSQGTMPGGQARMSGSPPQRRSKRCSHSCLTACPAPRRPATRRGRWWTRLRRVLLRWQAPQPCPADRPTRLTRPNSRGLDPYGIPYVNPYGIPCATGGVPHPSPLTGICPAQDPRGGPVSRKNRG